MSKAEQLAAVLDEFLAVSLDVEAAAVVSSDGLPMASALPPAVQEDRLAAMSAALLSLGERAAAGLDKGELAQVYVEGSDGNVVLMAAGPHAVLVAMTAKHAKAGLVLFEMRGSARRVEQVLEEPHAFDQSPARGRHEAVASHTVDPTPEPPPEPSPYTAPETEPPRPAWEERPVQATPEWEAQPAAQPADQPEWAESPEGADQWGEQQPQEQPHHEQAHHDEQPKQWGEDADENRDEDSSLKSW